jgi:hypothetical protein
VPRSGWFPNGCSGAHVDGRRSTAFARSTCHIGRSARTCIIAWRGEIQRTRKGETQIIAIDGVVERAFDGYIVPASGSLPADLVRSVEPFPLTDLCSYDTRYLAGSTVEVYAMNMWDAWDVASARMQAELDAELKKDSKCSPLRWRPGQNGAASSAGISWYPPMP